MSSKIKPCVILLAVAVISIVASISIAYAQQSRQVKIIVPTPAYFEYVPGTPVWNNYAPGNLLWWTTSYEPFAWYNTFTGQFWPVLARNWTIKTLPNGSAILTVYLKPGFYWYNGSATIPFTAWDAYAYFYLVLRPSTGITHL